MFGAIRGKVIYYFVCFAILSAASFALFYIEYKNRESDTLDSRIRETDISLKSVVNSFGLLSDYFYENVVKDSGIADILLKASVAPPEEKDVLREQLYRRLKVDYENLRRRNVGELHFHLPDSESFLRFSSPGRFGGKLVEFRESFKVVGLRGKSVSGFETGRLNNGFRYIYPLYKNGVFAGSFETCVSFDAVRNQISKIFQFETSLILRETVFSKDAFKEIKEKNFIPSDISKGYYYSKSILNVKRGHGENGISAGEIGKIDAALKKDKSLSGRLSEENPFAVYIRQDGMDYVVVFSPLNDISGHSIGYIVAYSRNDELSGYFKTFIEKSLVMSAAFFLFLLLLFLRGSYRSRMVASSNELRCSREMFESMTSNVPGIIYRWYQNADGQCGYSYISPRAKDILGISAEDLVRDYTLLKMHPEDFQCWKKTVAEACREMHDWSFEGRFILPTGKTMWWSGAAKPVTANEKEIVFDGIVIDITAQKEAELRIRENEERLRKILESMPVLLIAFDREMRIITWNHECEKVTGYHKDEVLCGSDAFELMYPDNFKHIYDVFGSREDFLDAEFDMICKDGSTSTIKWSKVSTKVPVTGWYSWLIGVDVTHRKETEEALWQRDLLLGATSQIGTLLLSAFDPDSAVKQSLELVGPVTDVDVINIFECRVNPDDSVVAELQYEWASPMASGHGRTISSLQSLELSDKFHDWFDSMRNGGCVSGIIDLFPEEQRKVFSFLPVQSLLSTPIILHGKLWGFVIYYDCHSKRRWTDNENAILETVGCTIGGAILRQRAEASLDEARKKAEAATTAKTEFLANMSHDIRTPLNGIVGMAQILSSSPLDSGQKQCVETMLLSSELLLAIINDILDLSKIEAGKLEIEELPFNLKLTLKNLYEIMKVQAEKKDVDFLYNYEDNCPEDVVGDEVRVRQIIMNLLGNALKFTQEGYVKLAVDCSPGTLPNGGREFIIKVEDSGIGISKDKISRLFEKYTQEEISTTRIYGGTGLGLSICKMLAEKMGGSISVDSSKGSGSLFIVRLPMKPSTEKVIQVREEFKLAWARNPLVLVVDDSDINRKIAVALLEKNGCRAETARDGKEALEKLSSRSYDLIAMDILMPVMDGIEATIEIRRLEGEKKDVPIVALTANAIHTEREKCLSSGMDDYLTKPVQEIELKKMLMRNLPSLLVANQEQKVPEPHEEKKMEVNTSPMEPDSVLLDADNAIVAIGGNKEFYAKLLTIFLEDSRADVKGLEAFSCDDGDPRIAAKTAHKIKGEAASIGAERLRKAALEAETAGKAGDMKKLSAAIGSVVKVFGDTCSEIEKYLSN